ncbi:hypothetical protein HKD37_03G007348 [Glycine soja]
MSLRMLLAFLKAIITVEVKYTQQNYVLLELFKQTKEERFDTLKNSPPERKTPHDCGVYSGFADKENLRLQLEKQSPFSGKAS